MRSVLLLLARAGVARAQGFDVAVDGVEVSALADLFERYSRVRVDVEVARRKVTLRVEKARPETAEREIAFDPRATAVVGGLKLRTPARAIAARSAVTRLACELHGDGVAIRTP